MNSIYIIFVFMIACLILVIFYQRERQRKLLFRMDKMLEDARNGRFRQEHIDEEMISSIENSMKLFLQDSLLNEENLQSQRDKIQTLISDISHQTITPLSNIMIYSQLLEEELLKQAPSGEARSVEALSGNEQPEGALPEVMQWEKARAIRQQAEKLDFLLQTMVKTSRLETGVIKTVPKRCDLVELMDSVVAQGSQKAKEKEISIVFDRVHDGGNSDSESKRMEESVFAMCDPKWTREACFNILDNAIKYTGTGGRIEVSITGYQMFMRIDIKDNGIGVEETEIPMLFGRFYRGTQAGNEEGVGLGLYLARQIVQSQSGYIKVSSKLGAGSCFSVFLPASR